MMKISGKKIATGLTVVVLVIAGLVWKGKQAAPAEGAASATAGKNQTIELLQADIHTVTNGKLTRRVSYTGTVNALNQTIISAPVDGKITDILVRPGDTVRKGQPLAHFDLRDLSARVDARRAALDSAKAQLAVAEKNQASKEALFRQNFISKNALDESGGSLADRQAAVAAQLTELKIAQKSLAEGAILAPFDGVIGTRDVTVGQEVGARIKMFTLVDLQHLEIEAAVPADQVAALSVGMPSSFRVEGADNQIMQAQLARISPITQAGTRSVPIYLQITTHSPLLRAGIFASGDIDTATSSALTVPATAIMTDAGRPQVWMIRAGRLVLQDVVLGARDASTGMVAIQQGLNAGDLIVRVRLPDARAGMAVSISSIKS